MVNHETVHVRPPFWSFNEGWKHLYIDLYFMCEPRNRDNGGSDLWDFNCVLTLE